MSHRISTTLFLLSPVDADLRPHFNHENDIQPLSSPQYLFSTYVPWPVSRQSESLMPENRENRLSACVTGRPQPPRRLQSQRKVTMASSWWEIANIWRLEISLRWCYRAAVRQWCWICMHSSHKTLMPSKKSTTRFRRKNGPQCQCGYRWEPSRYEAHNNFWYFATLMLLERSMCFFCGLGISKQIILWVLCGFAIVFPVMRWPPKPDEVQ